MNTKFIHSNPKKLIEDQEGAICSEINLNFSSIAVAYKFDNLPKGTPRIFQYFSVSSCGQNQVCDYIVIKLDKVENNIYIYLCNLKSKNPSNSLRQITNTYAFVKYIVEMASLSLNGNDKPSFVKFLGIHFMKYPATYKPPTNPRNLKFETSKNGLRHLKQPCDRVCNLDYLKFVSA